jgi:glutathione S-transferase
LGHILYSYRRCPYAMRARYTLIYAGIDVQIREIELRNKPPSMLALSPKGTVPVLLTADEHVLEESLDIMHWALAQNDPHAWLPNRQSPEYAVLEHWIAQNDGPFKKLLDQYKYPQRYPNMSSEETLQHAFDTYLQPLNNRLAHTCFLLGDSISMLDVALFPFVRQFAHVNETRFTSLSLEFLSRWLNFFILSDLFHKAMAKYPVWRDETA